MSRDVSVPRSLLEALAPERPMTDSEMGGCVWCGGTGYSRSSADFGTHAAECPWVVARTLLGAEIDETI